MAFVTNNTAAGSNNNNDNDILVLQKTSGEVHLIRNGRLQQFPPVLKETVTSVGEQGMLTIATKGNNNKVYIYFTEAASMGGQPLGKRVYSYDWNGEQLVNKTLVKDMPQTQTYHNGGAMTFDKNGTLYIAVGDAGRYGVLQNNPTNADGGKAPDDTSVIQQLVPPGPYRAIGVRNSFSLATDPVTGAIWDTENGDTVYDEINIVPPNFNSGWNAIMGPAHNYNKTQLDRLTTTVQGQNYVYHDPQFSWEKPIAPTGLAFVPPNSEAFAAKYGNSLFVGGFNTGTLYRFQLNENRDGFVFNSPKLKEDDVANIGDSQDEITFGTGFGAITDVMFGPDGFLYVVSLSDGTIYRIVPASIAAASENPADASNNPLGGNYPLIATVLGGGGILGYYFGRKFKRRRA
ncbi:MAG TPA: PQQ-dependent sugar dehydrogenase [Nitrososphaera sp.]|nr:PQQ-dependent sugar dehydrogenase [Nitrososphaera sp.]